MKTKTLISKFNKVSGYDFNTLKELSITPQAVLERTGCQHLEIAYDALLECLKIERLQKIFLHDEKLSEDLEYWQNRAKFRLKIQEMVTEINNSPLMIAKY